jgi:DNA-binding transcriptional LysR family regulator
MDLLDSMRLFCQVIDAGGFAKAAKALGLSPTAVTQGVSRLEHHYNARLLERTTRKVSVTEAGVILYDRAKNLLDSAQAVEDAVRAINSEPHGKIRLTLPLGLATTYLYPSLAEFASLYPRISLDIQVNDAVVDLVAGNYDIGLRVGVLSDAQVVAYPLMHYRRLTCASPAYIERNGIPSHPDDLTHHACLVYRHDPFPITWEYKVHGKIKSYSVQGPYSGNESYGLIAMAVQGLGICRQPDWLLNEEIRRGLLVPVLEDFSITLPQQAPGVYALLPQKRYRTAKVDAFLKFIKDRMQPKNSSSVT